MNPEAVKIIIGICFIVLVCSARGENEVCRATRRSFDICEVPPTTITHVRREDPSVSDNQKSLSMTFYRDTIIIPNAFIALNPTSVNFKMPYTLKRHKCALHTLTLHSDSFVGLSNADDISITYANINLCGKTLTSITNLKWFSFMYCGFTEVPTDMLKSTPNLNGLSFKSNYISIIRPNAFLPLKNLRELHLEDNGITALEPGCFNGLDNLEVLGVSGNHFRAEPSIFNGLTKLRHLHIENVSDDEEFIVNILQNLPTITYLAMGRNNITSLKPVIFDIVPQLVFLSLFNNQITSVPRGMFNKLKSLKFVDLVRNHIKTIEPGAFPQFNIYRSIDLSDNEVDKIIETGTFSNLITRDLNLRYSNITELKARAFDGLSTKRLDLTMNKLKQIGAEDFLGLETKVLDLSDNEIKKIAPNAFKNTKVKELSLARNPIDVRDRGNWGLPKSTKVLMKSWYES